MARSGRTPRWRLPVDRRRTEPPASTDIPAQNSAELVSVPTLILEKPSRSKLNKYWARRDGGCFFVCPYEDPMPKDSADDEPVYRRVILSLDPNWAEPDTGSKPTLQGLGYALEMAEGAYRAAHGGETRSGLPRYEDAYCTHDDPWYDGRGQILALWTRLEMGRACPTH